MRRRRPARNVPVHVNKWHAELLGTAEWAAFLHEEILPVVTQGVDLGDDLLEIGPGPGAATEWLRHRVHRLVAVELEPEAPSLLGARFAGPTSRPWPATPPRWPTPTSPSTRLAMFTMLHHVPTRALQDRHPRRGAARAAAGRHAHRLGQPGQRPACTGSTRATRTTRSSRRRSSPGCRRSASARSRSWLATGCCSARGKPWPRLSWGCVLTLVLDADAAEMPGGVAPGRLCGGRPEHGLAIVLAAPGPSRLSRSGLSRSGRHCAGRTRPGSTA